jgi:Type I restriction enzyme R protein N terminus (HSDR_N)
MVTLRAKEITLKEVNKLLGFQPLFRGRFEDFLQLRPLTELEEKELDQISDGKISEGQARQIAIAPLLRLAGYNRSPIVLRIEEEIQRISIKDKDTHITGRFDLVAVNRMIETSATALLWVLVVESKNISASEFTGIAQLLTYAHTSLQQQRAVWGLVTNGATYQFFHIVQGESPTYQYMPVLRLLERDRSMQLLQVLKSIRDWTP